MRVRTTAAAVVIGMLAVAAAGCGRVHHNGPEAAAGHHAVLQRCVRPPVTSSKTITITDKGNGKAYCVPPGTGIYVFLHGTLVSKWSPVQSSSAVLSPRPSGVMALAVGVTGAYYGVNHAGTATLVSERKPCRASVSKAAASKTLPGCTAQNLFRVTIVVGGSA